MKVKVLLALIPSTETGITVAVLGMILAGQGPAWAEDVKPANKDENWIRVEDLEQPDTQTSTPTAAPKRQGWESKPKPHVSRPNDASQIPSNWQFKTRSVEEGAPEMKVDPQTTFTF